MNPITPPPRIRVLIVDDSPDATESLALLVKSWGFDVRTANDGHEGWQLASTYKPDCVISDIDMPGMDGYTLAEQLRRQGNLRGLKLVALTGTADVEHDKKALESGFDYRLTKPAGPGDIREILRMIEQVKELASQTRDLTEQNVELAAQTKEIMQEVKEDLKEVKQDLEEIKAVKDDLMDVKDEVREIKEHINELKERVN